MNTVASFTKHLAAALAISLALPAQGHAEIANVGDAGMTRIQFIDAGTV